MWYNLGWGFKKYYSGSKIKKKKTEQKLEFSKHVRYYYVLCILLLGYKHKNGNLQYTCKPTIYNDEDYKNQEAIH